MDAQFDNAGVSSLATAQEAGELFEYAIATPVSVARQHAALLPIVNEAIEGTKVSIYNPASHPKYPLNGLALVNSTKLHLMQGPVTLFDGNVYAGDAKLPDLNPGEKRLIAYALDLAAEVTVEARPQPDELVRLRIAKGVLWHQHKFVDERLYHVKNKADQEKTVLLEQPLAPGWTLVEPKEPSEKTPNLLRFQVRVPAGKTVSQKVVLEMVSDQSVALAELGFDQIRSYLQTRIVSPKVKEALEKVIALRTELDRVARQRGAAEKAVTEAAQEQGRVRENLKTLDKGSDPYQRQLRKFDELETRIETGREQIESLRKDEDQKRQALETYLLGLEIG